MHSKVSGLLAASILMLTPSVQAADAKTGEALFNSRACVACHSIGTPDNPTATGPNLLGVTKRRSQDWIVRWIKNPDAMRKDPEIAKLSAKYQSEMPNLGLSDEEVQSVLLYLRSKDK